LQEPNGVLEETAALPLIMKLPGRVGADGATAFIKAASGQLISFTGAAVKKYGTGSRRKKSGWAPLFQGPPPKSNSLKSGQEFNIELPPWYAICLIPVCMPPE
jgi:hypothetical protein